jgi:hypothetical protein
MSSERNSSTVKSVEGDRGVLTATLASRIFTKSFELSSYDITLQDDFFVAINKIKPVWSIDEPMKQEILNTSFPVIKDLFLQDESGENEVTEESIKEIAEERLSSMQHKFTGVKEARGIGDPLQIAQLMLLEDLRYYYKFYETSKFANSVKVQYASQFCKYVIEQQPTGLDLFDAIFRVVKRDFEAVDFRKGPLIKKFKYLNLIKDVVNNHIESNPEKEEFYKALISNFTKVV